MKKKLSDKQLGLICFCGLIILLLVFVFVILPTQENARMEMFKDNQEVKIGKIILVMPGQYGTVYFEDGSIMGRWQREDYSEFSQYINKQVRILYGEIKICDDCSVDERMLFNIIEQR